MSEYPTTKELVGRFFRATDPQEEKNALALLRFGMTGPMTSWDLANYLLDIQLEALKYLKDGSRTIS